MSTIENYKKKIQEVSGNLKVSTTISFLCIINNIIKSKLFYY